MLVTFTIVERLILAPVEIALIWKIFAIVTLAIFILSGIGPDIYSFEAAWQRGITATVATILAILAGALITPVFLPWIPGRQFWLKGILAGGVVGLAQFFISTNSNILENIGIVAWIAATASYMAMNFTGATPYTSLSGVEIEMRRGLPVQCCGFFIALILWIAAPFIN